MKRWFALGAAMLSWNFAVAQDLMVSNARIIEGTGRVIERGTLVVANGRIVSVGEDRHESVDAIQVDATGMTVMPGLINTHWHVLTGAYPTPGDDAIDRYIEDVVGDLFEALLARGMTTILSVGDLFPNIIELRQKLRDGEIRGPRLLVVGPVFTAPNDWPTPLCRGNERCKAKAMAQMDTPDQARAKVKEVAAAGVDGLKLVYDDQIVPNIRIADDVVAAIADEARQHGLTLFAHVSTVDETALTLVELGVRGLVHPVPFRKPHSRDGARVLRDLDIPVATTISVRAPEWREFASLGYTDADQLSFNQRLEDIRHLWDAGITVAFGTDTTTRLGGHEERFWAEVRALNQVLTNQEVITALTRNAAVFVGLGDELGTLEAGKVADLLLVDGDPLVDLANLAKVKMVIQGGRIVVDRR